MAEPDSGAHELRKALYRFNKKNNLAHVARDLGVSIPALEAFVGGQAKLTPEVLQKLATFLWAGHTEYDPVADRLQSTNRAEPRPTGPGPAPFDPKTVPPHLRGYVYDPAAVAATRRAYAARPAPPPLPKRRPGWSE